ncbi:MAG: hypothetical protein HRU26_05840 [Psychroserpens sp.]|nr:hypothetical protein [Psychroserpens sp.]
MVSLLIFVIYNVASGISFKRLIDLKSGAKYNHALWMILGFVVYPLVHYKRNHKITEEFSA